MRKIFIDRQEPLTEIVERIIRLPDLEIRIVIPRDAVISSSAQNFDILKREIATEGKTLSVESVDETALAHARENNIEAVHPLLMGLGGKSLSDIVATGMRSSKAAPAPRRNVEKAAEQEKPAKRGSKEKETRHLTVHDDEDTFDEGEESEEVLETFEPNTIESREVVRDVHPADSDEDIENAPIHYYDNAPRRRKWPWIVLATLIAVGVAVWALGNMFAKATVTLEFNKTPWTFNGPVSIKTSETNINAETNALPGEIFTESRNMTNLFPVSGRDTVQAKAAGTITIFNNYSPEPQTLVATTRFTAPDGTLFRLVETTTVPGATVKDGKVTASSVDAKVASDKPGEAYNVGPIDRLTIPGFEGTPRYEGFYGKIAGKLSGGFIGERAVATEADIEEAKDRTEEILTANLTSGVLRNQPVDFMVVEGATEVNISRIAVVSSTLESGDKVGVFGEGEIKAIAFREPDMKSLLTTLARPAESTLVLANLTIGYENPEVDFEAGILTLTVKANGTLTGEFDEEEVKSMLAGKGIGPARNAVLTLPDLNRARISLWPWWVKTVPQKDNRITIQVE